MEKPKTPIDAIKPLPTSYYPHPLFHRPFLTPHSPNPKSPKSTHPSHPNSITARKNIAALKLSARSFETRLWCCCAEIFVKGEVTGDLVGGGGGGGGGGRWETWGRQKGEVEVVGERVMRVLQVPAPEVSLSPHL